MKWLILRGLIREQRHWGNFPQVFEERLKKTDAQSRVYTLDFPGFGKEASRTSPFTISGIVDDLRKRWIRLSAGEDWSVLSISMGGMVALDWSARYPNDFKKLVLINSSIRETSAFYRRLKPKNYQTFVTFLFNSEVRAQEEAILRMTTNLEEVAIKARAEFYSGFALPVRKRDAVAQLYSAATFKAPGKIGVPALVLASRQDQLVDVSCSIELAKKYRAEIRLHPNANHDLPMDEPDWVSEQVSEWAYPQVRTKSQV
ncbi:MAG: alpha/beta hydrolase [Bdellovibrionales bacterium]|nr:alpha/beta hydrolase [Oligoflexia bacterium]